MKSADTGQPAPLDIPQQDAAGDAAANIFDELVALNVDKDAQSATSPVGASHPPIFRKGTLIEILEAGPTRSQRQKPRQVEAAARQKQRLVAVCIKDDAQAEYVSSWVLQNELMLGRDNVVLVNVRAAANSIIGDLTLSNSAKDDAERTQSHALLRKHAAPIKQEGFPIKGVSIRGVDIRGELVRKLIELKCDLVVVGNGQKKSVRERLTGCKASYLLEYSPCPVLVVGSGMKRYGKGDAESQ
ncbi:hypothetical protein H4R20_004329 [Coemansia guatemalensis]|uniref:UspA domain-containing protein n=1 Tax=Coemansia guatemalensis TaxID=2761395 RepID=A0A9W8LRU5_9FUNG|nr:hypothetical protein H4R20_004329 [Coemansia guatemalensis]